MKIINKGKRKDINILFKYIKDKEYYSKINVFDYNFDGDIAIVVHHTQSSLLSSILILRKNLDFLNKHKHIVKYNPNQLILVKEEIKRNGYYIQEITIKMAGLEDRNPDIIIKKDGNIILRYLNRKDIPYIKTYLYEPPKQS